MREVRYTPPRRWFERHLRWILLAYVAMAVASAITRHSWCPLLAAAMWLGVILVPWWLMRTIKGRDLVATSDRIRRPIVGFDIPWSQVECVIAPNRFDEVVRVVVKGGKERLTGFPPAYAERLAEMGQRPLRERRDLEDERGR